MEKVWSAIKCFPKNTAKTPLKYYILEVKELHKAKNLADEMEPKINMRHLWARWNSMPLEDKRKYFNISQTEQVKYRERLALWQSKFGSELAKNGLTIEALKKLKESSDTNSEQLKEEEEEKEVNKENSEALERYKKNYEKMIQARSTLMLYKKAIMNLKRSDGNITINKEDLISTISDKYKPFLIKPRRPSSMAFLFAVNEKERLLEVRREKYPNTSFLACACKEWVKLSQERKDYYANIYKRSVEEYLKAKEEFKLHHQKSGFQYLEQALKEKSSFNKSLRKRVRKSPMVPLNARNAFNFYVMEKKNRVEVLAKSWRELTEEEKAEYVQLSLDDQARYTREKNLYDSMMKDLLEKSKENNKEDEKT